MKKLFIFLLLITGNYIYSDCPEVLDHEIRLLDSSESENLCKYKDKVILAVNVLPTIYSNLTVDKDQKAYYPICTIFPAEVPWKNAPK